MLQIGNEGMIRSIIMNDKPSNPPFPSIPCVKRTSKILCRYSIHPFSGVGQCPNVSHHPTIGDIISNRYLFWWLETNSPKRDINPSPCVPSKSSSHTAPRRHGAATISGELPGTASGVPGRSSYGGVFLDRSLAVVGWFIMGTSLPHFFVGKPHDFYLLGGDWLPWIWHIFPEILGISVIIPSDFHHIFQRGGPGPPVMDTMTGGSAWRFPPARTQGDPP